MDNSLSLTKPLEKWSQDIENVLDRIRVNAYNMSEIHRKRFLHFKAFSNYFDIRFFTITQVLKLKSETVNELHCCACLSLYLFLFNA